MFTAITFAVISPLGIVLPMPQPGPVGIKTEAELLLALSRVAGYQVRLYKPITVLRGDDSILSISITCRPGLKFGDDALDSFWTVIQKYHEVKSVKQVRISQIIPLKGGGEMGVSRKWSLAEDGQWKLVTPTARPVPPNPSMHRTLALRAIAGDFQS